MTADRLSGRVQQVIRCVKRGQGMMTVEEALASIEAADCVASLEQVRLMLVGK